MFLKAFIGLKYIFIKMLQSKNDRIHDYYLVASVLYVIYGQQFEISPFSPCYLKSCKVKWMSYKVQICTTFCFVFSRIWTAYEDFWAVGHVSPLSVQIRGEEHKNRKHDILTYKFYMVKYSEPLKSFIFTRFAMKTIRTWLIGTFRVYRNETLG